MILKDNISSLVGNHVAPYIYNANNFEPGKTFIYYSGLWAQSSDGAHKISEGCGLMQQ